MCFVAKEALLPVVSETCLNNCYLKFITQFIHSTKSGPLGQYAMDSTFLGSCFGKSFFS